MTTGRGLSLGSCHASQPFALSWTMTVFESDRRPVQTFGRRRCPFVGGVAFGTGLFSMFHVKLFVRTAWPSARDQECRQGG